MGSVDTTSWRLIRAAATGDPSERAGFVDRYQRAVAAFFAARWRRSPLGAQAEDAAQEVFVECLRPGGVLEKADSSRAGGFRALFFGVLRNVAGRYETKAGAALRRQSGAVPPDSLPSGDSSPSAVCDRRWAQELIAEVVRRFAALANGDAQRQQRRDLLRLRFEEGLPIRSIAVRLGIDVERAHHQYATARAEFERVLRETLAEQVPNGQRRRLLQSLVDAL